jgi:predicted TIM-barrel fold metal-dependent hydrolase
METAPHRKKTMIHRRGLLTASLAAAGLALWPGRAGADDRERFDMPRLKAGYRDRLRAVRKAGDLPIFDIESSYNPVKIDLVSFVRDMDRGGVAMMALSVDQPGSLVKEGQTWGHQAFDLVRLYPDRFLPTGNGGVHPAWTKNPDRFLDDNQRFIVENGYPLMGEFEFRHYPSPRQIERGETYRDVAIPIDGPQGERLFAFAEATGIPFQIHYEIEDALLPPLETMLARHPKAKVIWCHFAQIRYAERNTVYGAAYLDGLFAKFPNLTVDTAFGGPTSIYKPSGQAHARAWTGSGDIRPEWKELMRARPERFLAALDIGGDRMDRLSEWIRNLRYFLGRVPEPVRDQVAYGSAWKLLFGEEIPL